MVSTEDDLLAGSACADRRHASEEKKEDITPVLIGRRSSG